MKLFKHHLTTFEGGSRKLPAATDHMRRIGQLLYQIHDTPQCTSLLLQDSGINLICQTVFEGNDLAEKPKAPQTLTTFVVSMHLFFKFVIARQEAIKRLINLTDEDIKKVNSALTRVKILQEESSSESEIEEEGNEGTIQKESVRESEDIVDKDKELCEPPDGEEKENDDEDVEVEGAKIVEEEDDGKQLSEEEQKHEEEKERQESEVEKEREERETESEEKEQMGEPRPTKRDGLSLEQKKKNY